MEVEIYSDGGARGNPGKAAIGYVIVVNGKIVVSKGEYVGIRTNNQAEYLALTKALQTVLGISNKIKVYSDSELMIRQLLGEYKVKNPQLKELYLEILKLIEKFDEISFKHVTRENKFIQIADRNVNDCLDRH